ncbi:MAG TPA: hypothetical protein PLQ88_22895 [Blastocatellia bacterium]|nr:hypothetical protein [Blastocatellia bacterium]
MTVFTINETEFGWEEIVAAAEVWGEWQPFVTETRQKLACLAYAAETDQLPAAAEVREAATAFRYAHNLISAEDTQAWLNRWEMTVNDWMNCLRGQLLRDARTAQLDQIVAEHPVSEEDLCTVIKHYAVCTGKLPVGAKTGRTCGSGISRCFRLFRCGNRITARSGFLHRSKVCRPTAASRHARIGRN